VTQRDSRRVEGALPEGEEGTPQAVIVTIGDELLSGERLDTNAAWLARRLGDLGFLVQGIRTVGDGEESIGSALEAATREADLVVATGGLGPTLDDRTRDAVSARWSLPLHVDEEVLERIRARFRHRGYHDVPDTNRRTALVPEGARVLENPRGSAPGLLLRVEVKRGHGPALLLLLPGVPREMRALMGGPAGEALFNAFRGRVDPARSLTILTTGIPESVLAGRIEAVIGREDDVEVAYRPSLHGVELRLLARGRGADEALRRARERIEPVLAEHRYHAPSGDLAEAVGQALAERGMRIAVAESCTGGLVLKRLTDISGSSGWVVGGVVAYADRIKEEWVDVPHAILAAHGAVSEGVARTLAEGIRRRMGVEVGVGITGIAGPGGEAPGKPVGLVWFAVSGPGETRAERIRFSGDREEIRERAAQHALHLVLRDVQGLPGAHGTEDHFPATTAPLPNPRADEEPGPGGGANPESAGG
jgi:nicotinamide-nucleotide amidase